MNRQDMIDNTNSDHRLAFFIKADQPVAAVMVRKDIHGPKILWLRQAQTDQTVSDFVEQTLAELEPADIHNPPEIVLCIDSPGIVMYSLSLPPVEEDKLASMVDIQVQALLPLPADQMAWATDVCGGIDNQNHCTVAAARNTALEGFVSLARKVRAAQILIRYEALASGIRRWISQLPSDAVVLYPAPDDCILLHLHGNKLLAAVSIHTEEPQEEAGCAIDRMSIMDLNQSLESMSVQCTSDNPLYIVSPNIETSAKWIEELSRAGIPAVSGQLDIPRDMADEGITAEAVFANLETVSTGVVDINNVSFNLTKQLYTPPHLQGEQSQKPATLLPAGLAVLGAVLIFILGFFWVDSRILANLNRHLSPGEDPNQTSTTQLVEETVLQQKIAAYRINLLDVLNQLNEAAKGDIQLDDFHFQMNRPIVVTGRSGSFEQLYEFQTNLAALPGFHDVEIKNPRQDEKSKKVEWKMTFKYKHYTEKR